MGGVVCTVIFVSNQPVVLGCVGVGVLTIVFAIYQASEFKFQWPGAFHLARL